MSLLQDLKNFPSRFNNKSKIIVPERKPLNVMVAFCIHRQVDPRVIQHMNILNMCPDPKITTFIKEGDGLIDRARAMAATRFLEDKKQDILFFIDDDIVYNPHEIAKISKLMISENLDICGGAYVFKREGKTSFVIKTLDDTPIRFGKDGAIVEIRYLSTGFFAIQRKVIERMVEKNIVHLCHPTEAFRFYPFFTPMEKCLGDYWIYLSEDWAFCDRARELGFKIWLDTTVKLGHIGRKIYDWDDMINNTGDKVKETHESFEYCDKDNQILVRR